MAKTKMKIAREASSYRAARRNFCLRIKHSTWRDDMYYKEHSCQIKLRPYQTKEPKMQFRLSPITHNLERKITHRKPQKVYPYASHRQQGR